MKNRFLFFVIVLMGCARNVVATENISGLGEADPVLWPEILLHNPANLL